MAKVLTESEVAAIGGTSTSYGNRCCTKARAEELGCIVTEPSGAISNQLITGVQRNFPYDAVVQYLFGDGHQYIDTGIVPDSSTGIKITCQPSITNYDGADDIYIVGLRDNSSNTRWCLGKAGNASWGKAGVYYGYGTYEYFGQSEYDDDRYYPYGTTFTLSLNFLNSKYAVNGERDSISLPSTMPFTATNVIRIFGSSGVTGDFAKYAGRIYSVQISQGNNMIMNLIPVRKDGVGYMYDTIGGNLYENNGTGNFAYGPDVS